jgi:hypothetical protein
MLMKKTEIKLTIISVLLIMLLSVASVPTKAAAKAPETQWEKTYGPLYGFSVVQTSDGGYAIAGVEAVWETAPRGGGSWTNNTFLLIKTDAEGEVQWRKNYTRGNAYSVSLTNDGSYVLAGRGESNLVKVDSEGNMQWSKTFGGAVNDIFTDVIQVSDGGYVIAGITDSIRNPVVVVVKFSAFGELVWEKSYEGEHRAESLIVTFDGGYAFAGYRNRDVERNIAVCLVKIAPDPNAQETELLYTTLIVVAVVIVVAGLGLGLLIYLIKRK